MFLKNIEQLEDLVDDMNFWQHQNNGLAIFVTYSGVNYFKLPISFGERMVLANKPYIKPLLWLFDRFEFYVLSLNLNNLRLFKCSNYDIEEIEMENVPKNIEEALKFDDIEDNFQIHIGSTRKLNTSHAGNYFSQGEKTNKHNDDIIRFFHVISKYLHKINSSNLPIILSGIEHNTALYRSIKPEEIILKETINKNLDLLPLNEIYTEANKIIEPYIKKNLLTKISNYYEKTNKNKIRNKLTDIVVASYNGRVELFIISKDSYNWGSYDNTSNLAVYSNQGICNNDDLINQAIIYSLLKGTSVYVVDKEHIPNEDEFIAFLRY